MKHVWILSVDKTEGYGNYFGAQIIEVFHRKPSHKRMLGTLIIWEDVDVAPDEAGWVEEINEPHTILWEKDGPSGLTFEATLVRRRVV